jgi:hypothetical protein
VKVRAKNEAQESHFMLSGVWENVREWTPTLQSEFPFWELESQWIPEFSKSNCKGQNPLDWKIIYIIGNCLELDVLNGLTWPIWLLKTQIMAKRRVRVKLPFWLLTTKTQKLAWFPCMQVVCHIPLESSWWGL